MWRNNWNKLLGIILLVGVIIFFLISIIQFLFWYYPKNCIFFEFDFSKKCASDTWEYVTNWNKEKVDKWIETWINNYIEHKVEKAENKAERIQESLKNINITQTWTTK